MLTWKEVNDEISHWVKKKYGSRDLKCWLTSFDQLPNVHYLILVMNPALVNCSLWISYFTKQANTVSSIRPLLIKSWFAYNMKESMKIRQQNEETIPSMRPVITFLSVFFSPMSSAVCPILTGQIPPERQELHIWGCFQLLLETKVLAVPVFCMTYSIFLSDFLNQLSIWISC